MSDEDTPGGELSAQSRSWAEAEQAQDLHSHALSLPLSPSGSNHCVAFGMATSIRGQQHRVV